MVSNAERQRCYRQRRALAAGSDADSRRQREAAVRCERQHRHRARLVLDRRTQTFATRHTSPPFLPPSQPPTPAGPFWRRADVTVSVLFPPRGRTLPRFRGTLV